MSEIHVSGSTEVDVDFSIDHEEALDQMDTEDILSYVADNFDKEEVLRFFDGEDIMIQDIPESEIMDYLVDEYSRGSFSNFDFVTFFRKIEKKVLT